MELEMFLQHWIFIYIHMNIYIIFVGENMQTNHDCYLTSLQMILGSNTVCPRLLTGLNAFILESVWAFFLLFCRGTFLSCFPLYFLLWVRACFILPTVWERSAHGHRHTQPQLRSSNHKRIIFFFFFPAFCFLKSRTLLLCLLCLYFFFFVKNKKVTLVLKSDMDTQQN